MTYKNDSAIRQSRLRRFAFLATILLVAVAVSASVFAWFESRSSVGRKSQQLPPVASPVALVHVPGGIPVLLSNFSVGGDEDGNGRQPYWKGLSFRVVGLRGIKLTSLNFTVFEFNAKGVLRRVSGFASEQDDISQRPADIVFPLERRLQPGDRLVLTIESVRNDAAKWEANFNELAKQAANLVKGKPPEVLTINENREEVPDSGAVLCLKNMRRANEFARPASDSEPPAKITSLACDQNQRTFSFTITGKSL